MSEHVFDPPERCVAGSVGPPGQRTFFIQATDGSRVMTVSLEKEQVKLLGESLAEMLDDVAGPDGSEDAAGAFTDNAPLDTPIEDDFRVQRLSVAWEAGQRKVVLEAFDRPGVDDLAELESEAESDEPVEFPWSGMPPQSLRVVLAPGPARAFALRCTASIEGGRPSCPFCGQPLDPSGHICPRANGYRR